jgi:hypothetical protein
VRDLIARAREEAVLGPPKAGAPERRRDGQRQKA